MADRKPSRGRLQMTFKPSAERYFIIYLFSIFALCERKNRKQKQKYHAAARPELVEGQAKNHVEHMSAAHFVYLFV